ncbi:uncharacterized protein [Macrobrachium rosenbergii]|uniref:uncharacterized protein n=1 Tax=Macrobrachium rosenbergii TaxID=79674 RepID=UPI0034D541BE
MSDTSDPVKLKIADLQARGLVRRGTKRVLLVLVERLREPLQQGRDLEERVVKEELGNVYVKEELGNVYVKEELGNVYVKEELGNVYDDSMYSEEIDIKEELIEPKQEPPDTEDRRGEKRRALSQLRSPDSKKQRPAVEAVTVENEPECDRSKVMLDWWHGVRATYGFLRGRLFYEVKVEDHLAVPHLEKEQHPHGLRCGWSIDSAGMMLGEEPFSYGYCGTAKASTDLKFKDYGRLFGKGDVIGCFLDMDSEPIGMSFSVNGKNFGKCYEVSHRSLRGKALFPHILTKNCAFKPRVSFGEIVIENHAKTENYRKRQGDLNKNTGYEKGFNQNISPHENMISNSIKEYKTPNDVHNRVALVADLKSDIVNGRVVVKECLQSAVHFLSEGLMYLMTGKRKPLQGSISMYSHNLTGSKELI